LLLFDDSNLKEEKRKRRKRPKKKIFGFGSKLKSPTQTRASEGQENRESFFNYTDAVRKLIPYIRDVFWLINLSEKSKNSGLEVGKGAITFTGPYERFINEVVVESGMYYYGTQA